jgi:hypothetical protein
MKAISKPRLMFITIVFLPALILAGCNWGGEDPQVTVSPVGFDFGNISADPVTTTFAVNNHGNRSLQIESITTSCGCTTAEISRQTIGPGESAKLTVNFDPQTHAGAVGDFLRSVYLRTNDPANPEVEVQIKANVVENSIVEQVSQ